MCPSPELVHFADEGCLCPRIPLSSEFLRLRAVARGVPPRRSLSGSLPGRKIVEVTPRAHDLVAAGTVNDVDHFAAAMFEHRKSLVADNAYARLIPHRDAVRQSKEAEHHRFAR